MDTFANAFSEAPKPIEVPQDDTPEVIEPAEPEKPVEPAKPEVPKEPDPEPVKTVPHQALHAERTRRLEAEARLAELEKKPKTSVLEDEDKAFNERLTDAVSPLRQQIFQLSVNYAKRGREDYDKVYEFMNAEVNANPALYSQIDPNDPGESIYKLGKIRMELAEVGGDLTKYREHVTKQVSSELTQAQAEIKRLTAELAARDASAEKRKQIPSSMNAESSAAAKDDVFSGPTPLKNVFAN